MANREKFLHNFKKAKRQREMKKDIQADNLRHMENMISVRKMLIRQEHERDLLEQKFLHNFKKAKRQRQNQEFVLNNIFKNYSKGLIEIIKNNESK